MSHARTLDTVKLKVLKFHSFFFFFSFQLPVSWDFPGMLRQGALAADHKAETFASSAKRLFTLQQAEEREARGLQQSTRNPTDFTREKQPAVPSGNSQLEMLGEKNHFRFLPTGIHLKIINSDNIPG